MANFEEAKQYLKKTSSGTNLYDHLSTLILKVVQDKPDDPLALFESISCAVKKSTFVGSNQIEGERLPGEDGPTPAVKEQQDWSEANFKLLRQDTDEIKPAPTIEHLPSSASLLEWAGVGIGKEETYRLYLALKQLAVSKSATNLRFWGKINGINSDYYIAEGSTREPEEVTAKEGVNALEVAEAAYRATLPNKEEAKLGDKADSSGGPNAEKQDWFATDDGGGPLFQVGVNHKTYWVCAFAGAPWVQLPDVTCAQVKASLTLKKFFTGNLEAPVTGYPPFDGLEKHLLRAQISRISAETVIAPTGLFEADDDAECLYRTAEEGPEEARAMEELAGFESWNHLHLAINPINGRSTAVPKKDEEEEEAEDEFEYKALRVVGEVEGFEEYWKVAQKGPGSTTGNADTFKYAVLRNLNWPGACTVATADYKYVNIYMGYGFRFDPKPYQPPFPGTLREEFGTGRGWQVDEEKGEWAVDADPEADKNANDEEIGPMLREFTDKPLTVDPAVPEEEEEEE
jgi:radial spoke head protein 4A